VRPARYSLLLRDYRGRTHTTRSLCFDLASTGSP
jgi:hypothetical protein